MSNIICVANVRERSRTYANVRKCLYFTMEESLENVIGIFDMDGFEINKKFYCKELGILRVGDIYAKSYFFDIGLQWCDLSERSKRQCHYVTENIHHLPFGVPQDVSAHRIQQLNTMVVNFYYQNRIDIMSKMAYKGGHYERDVLVRLGIPSVNLESYGCPKAEFLFKELGWLETCGNHLPANDVHKHCPKVEVEAFGLWLNRNV